MRIIETWFNSQGTETLVMMNYGSPGPNNPSLPCASRVLRNKLLPRMAHHTVSWLGSVRTAWRSYSWVTMMASLLKISVRTVAWEIVAVAMIYSSWVSTHATRVQGCPITLQYASRGKAPWEKGHLFFDLCLFCSQGPHPDVWAAIPPLLFTPVFSSGVKRSGSGMLKSQTLLWAGFFHRSVPHVEPCAWRFPSSPTDDILRCHEGAFLSSWWQWRVLAGSDSEGSRCWLRALHLWARVPLASIGLLCFPLNLNEHLGMSGADGMLWLLGSFLFWSMTSSSFPPLSFHVHTMLYTDLPCTHLSARQGNRAAPRESPRLL